MVLQGDNIHYRKGQSDVLGGYKRQNIHYIAIHISKSLFSIKLSLKWDQSDVSQTILNFSIIWALKNLISGLFYIYDYYSKTI